MGPVINKDILKMKDILRNKEKKGLIRIFLQLMEQIPLRREVSVALICVTFLYIIKYREAK